MCCQGDASLLMLCNQLIWSKQQQPSQMQGRHHMLLPRRWEDEKEGRLQISVLMMEKTTFPTSLASPNTKKVFHRRCNHY